MTAFLVPVDGSTSSLHAIDYAARQAKRCKAILHLLNVQLPVETYGMVPAYLSPRKHRDLTMPIANTILGQAAQRLKRTGIKCETHVVYGDIAASIVRASRRLRCEAIIMGTRGRGAIGDLLLGSIATKVTHLSRLPVTLVK
ncbi:MAG TPA: universal stress protein [Casimicrobiaceae bacterium]|nr:universal stress protein [Casimicrobiaceae bacterium]